MVETSGGTALHLEAGNTGKFQGKTSQSKKGDDENRQYLEVRKSKIEILKKGESTMYLGRLLNLSNPHDVEIDNRIKRGWKKFMSLKKELCCRHYPLQDRLKLFSATVTPTVLYGCGGWTAERNY